MSRLLTFGGPHDPHRARKRPRRESPVGPVGSIRRHQVQYKGRDLRKGRVYSPMVCLTGI